jgi:NAD(P)-dependent dehydrogenase (short-subunit alcohol dehydrogenase family)
MIADIADGKEVAESLARQHGANSVASAITDVSDEAAVKTLVAETMGRFGQIDVLVNNAALFAPLRETKCTEIDAVVWDRVMAINLRGPFLMVKHVAPVMSARAMARSSTSAPAAFSTGSPLCCTTSPRRAASWL